MKYHSIISSTIGSTPLVRLNRICEDADARIFSRESKNNRQHDNRFTDADRTAVEHVQKLEGEKIVHILSLLVKSVDQKFIRTQ